MIRRPTRSTRTDTLFPYTTLFRSKACLCRNVTAIGITREGREKPVSASNLSPATPKLIPMSAFSQLMCALKRIYLNYFSEGSTTMEATSFLLNKERFQDVALEDIFNFACLRLILLRNLTRMILLQRQIA